jgi:dTDP-4-dehydrorhamnose reductase
MKKILTIGRTGQVGSELERILAHLGNFVALGRESLNLMEPTSISQIIEEIKPNIIINAAAYTAVDQAETDREGAIAINGIAPTVMAKSAESIGAILIHISTDYVFDGQKNTPYLEQDSTNPMGVYGESKLMGERGIKENCQRHIILRTAWVYGSRGHGNFVKTMLRLGSEREELGVVVDQVGSPTWSQDIARAIADLVERAQSLEFGTYHFTNSGVASWYDLAVNIFTEAKKIGFPLKIQRVLPIGTAQYPTPAKRPAYSVLSNRKFADVCDRTPPYWRDALIQMLLELYS